MKVAPINPFRYRGYYFDTEIGMYYLQSRYYDPTVGRFINGDESNIVSIPTGNIIECDLLAYSNNAPIMYYDPMGFKAINITNKLTNLMRKNALKFGAYIVFQVLARGLFRGLLYSFKYFYNNSKTKGSWDLKNQGWTPGKNNWYVFRGKKLRYDDPGNIHFGYVGAVIFPLLILRMGAGLYQIYSGSSNWSYWITFFDDPRDSSMITWGYRLFYSDINKLIKNSIKSISNLLTRFRVRLY